MSDDPGDEHHADPKPTIIAESDGVRLLRSNTGEWGVQADGDTGEAIVPGLIVWSDEAEARKHYADLLGVDAPSDRCPRDYCGARSPMPCVAEDGSVLPYLHGGRVEAATAKPIAAPRRIVVYLAAPVSAPATDGVRANLARAKRWLWALRCATNWSICAPWIPAVEAVLDSGAAEHDKRARGLADDLAVVERCDALIGCGGRWSTGMLLEGKAARFTIDLTPIGEEPPAIDVLRAYIETLCGASMREIQAGGR